MRVLRTVRLAVIALAGFAALGLGLRERELSTPASTQTERPHRYDIEYPVMNYARGERRDPVARLEERISQGAASLAWNDERGYLDSLLSELGVDVASQSLVFSRTSAQTPFITIRTPRALYYTDDVYVGWPPDAPNIEISAMDPNLGPVFYTLAQDSSGIRFVRQMDDCLRCHDTYALTGGGVPRHLVGSGYTNNFGELVSHEGWILVDDRTPLRFRWGGWYVTGTHGDQTHMGNWIIRDPEELRDIDLTRTGNVTDLSPMVDTNLYPSAHSDIVALLVLDHQTHVQNVITRVNYETRTLLELAPGEPGDAELTEDLTNRIATITEPLVEALLMVDQPAFTGRIAGTTGFAEAFEARGPFDADGRTLRELDLETRLFRYPVSYLIHSDAFDALPEVSRRYVYRRLASVLGGRDPDPRFAGVSGNDSRAAMMILRDTKPEFNSLTVQ